MLIFFMSKDFVGPQLMVATFEQNPLASWCRSNLKQHSCRGIVRPILSKLLLLPWSLLVSVPDMRRPIRVQMVNWVGLDEAGIDGGGIFREFLAELIQTALDPSRGFFATTHDHLLYPNPLAPFLYPSNFQDHFYFIGRIIAKVSPCFCIFNLS